MKYSFIILLMCIVLSYIYSEYHYWAIMPEKRLEQYNQMTQLRMTGYPWCVQGSKAPKSSWEVIKQGEIFEAKNRNLVVNGFVLKSKEDGLCEGYAIEATPYGIIVGDLGPIESKSVSITNNTIISHINLGDQ